MRNAVMTQLNPSNIEINIVGDIAGADVDNVVLRYLGTVSPRAPAQPLAVLPPVILYPPAHLRRQAWHLKVWLSRDLSSFNGAALPCNVVCACEVMASSSPVLYESLY